MGINRRVVSLCLFRLILNNKELDFVTADSIRPNQSAEILDLDTGDTGQRLGEMGFWPGKSIQLLISAPFGDPLAFEIDNTVIALRKDEAKLIRVKVATTAA